MRTLPRADAWTENSIVEWWTRCDRCKRRRLRARYHEVHGRRPEPDQYGLTGCWWRECLSCMVQTLTALSDQQACPYCKDGDGHLHDKTDCPIACEELNFLLHKLSSAQRPTPEGADAGEGGSEG